MTFSFNARHIWSEATPVTLLEELRAYHRLRSARVALPLTIYASCENDIVYGLPASVVTMALRSAAERLPSLVAVRFDAPSPGAATVLFSEQRIEIDLGGSGVTLHHDIPYGVDRPIAQVGFDALLGIALALGRIGLASAAASIANLALPCSTFGEEPQYLARVGHFFAAAHRVAEGAELAKRLLSTGTSAPLVVGPMASELSRGWRTLPRGEGAALEQLLKIVAAALEAVDSGIAGSYWLAAAKLQQRNSAKDSIASYRRARALSPELEHDANWWAGLGGAAHDAREFDLAIAAYGHAIELGAEAEVLAALADSLVVRGRFVEAAKRFHQYEQRVDSNPKWTPSAALASRLAGMNVEGWSVAMRAFGAEEPAEWDGLPYEIILALAWYNCGCRHLHEGEHGDRALYCFFAAVVLFPGDDVSWVQSTVSAINLGNVSLTLNVMQSGYAQRGYAFLDELMNLSESLPVAVRENLITIAQTVISGAAFVGGRELTR
jgi:tetratricopeptide (TPR) repeat protein